MPKQAQWIYLLGADVAVLATPPSVAFLLFKKSSFPYFHLQDFHQYLQNKFKNDIGDNTL